MKNKAIKNPWNVRQNKTLCESCYESIYCKILDHTKCDGFSISVDCLLSGGKRDIKILQGTKNGLSS